MKDKKLNKKAQLTFFILMGFLIIIIMAVVFYVTKSQASHKTEAQAGLSQQTTLDIVNVKSYVTDCLRKVTNDGIKLLGEQGGIIYEDQGGNKRPILGAGFDLVNLKKSDKDIRVRYGLEYTIPETGTRTSICEIGNINFTCNSSLNQGLQGTFRGGAYPWINYSYPPGYRTCNGVNGCFGSSTLSIDEVYLTAMHNQLKTYINNTIESCLDFSAFKGFDIQLNGTYYVNVTTTNETVVSILTYPLIIIDTTSRKMNKIEQFYFDTNIRLKKMNHIANSLVKLDKDDERFDIVGNRNIVDSDSNLYISIITHSPSDNIEINPAKDNIVRILDKYAQKDFVFQFARMNRPPVLDRIPSPISVIKGQNINESFFNTTYISDPDDLNKVMYYYSTDNRIPLATPFKSFSFNATSIFCLPSQPTGYFTIQVCVSDELYPNPCFPSSDLSRDWQDVMFNITNCN